MNRYRIMCSYFQIRFFDNNYKGVLFLDKHYYFCTAIYVYRVVRKLCLSLYEKLLTSQVYIESVPHLVSYSLPAASCLSTLIDTRLYSGNHP